MSFAQIKARAEALRNVKFTLEVRVLLINGSERTFNDDISASAKDAWDLAERATMTAKVISVREVISHARYPIIAATPEAVADRAELVKLVEELAAALKSVNTLRPYLRMADNDDGYAIHDTLADIDAVLAKVQS